MKQDKITSLRTKILSYIKGLKDYYDIGFVLNNLESVIMLPNVYKIAYTSDNQYLKNKKLMSKTLSNVEIASKAFKKELDLRKRVFDQVRTFKPDFCITISSRLSKEQYLEYLEALKRSSKKITDLVSPISEDMKIDFSEILLQKQDVVSEIIDSEYTIKISNLEDSFVLSELEELDYSKLTIDLQQDINNLKIELQNRLKQNEFFYKLYSKDNRINLIDKER